MRDKRGILRGGCTICHCTEYISEGQLKCKKCNHVPAKHEDLGADLGQDDVNDYSDSSDNEVQLEAWDDMARNSGIFSATGVVYNSEDSGFTHRPRHCQFPGCNDVANFDLNTREYTSVYCYNHLSTTQPDVNSGQLFGYNCTYCIIDCYAPGNICGYPGCGKPCCVELDGTTHYYCSKFHARAIHALPIPTVQAIPTFTSPPSVTGAATSTYINKNCVSK